MRLLLEGPDLPTLLEQVRTEYGTTARIVHAEKVRRGGVGGFFARERFNIQVEVAEMQAVAPPEPEPQRGNVQSVMDLVDELNHEEESLYQDVVAAPRGPQMSPVAAGPPPALPRFGTPPQAGTERPSPSASGLVSTQSAAFTDVMSRLQQSIDSGASGASAADGTGSRPDLRGRAVSPRHAKLVQPPAPPAPRLRRGGERGPTAAGTRMAARATRLGVPKHVLAGIGDPADVYRHILSWVESRPMAPMIATTPGQVIVIVGEVRAAMDVAGSLARRLGVDPEATNLAVLASSTVHDIPAGQLLSDVSDMAVRRQRWQHSASGTIVVVEAALPPAARGWLAAVVSALAPTFTWAVAQASTKVNDVVSWAAAVGEVDALALMNVSATGDPAAALAGPLPIGLLDGHRATVPRWMAMLTEEGELR